jgi:crossover junction endodeoxyribonuclease RusA
VDRLVIAFVVRGIPVPQGTARAFVAGGRAVIATDSNRANSPIGAWRTAIATEARQAIGEAELLDGPVAIHVEFVFPRPKAHYRAGGEIRLDAPRYHRSRPDADKLLRALLDAVTGVLIRDDSQVADAWAQKLYEDERIRPGARVVVRSLELTR